MKKAKPFLSLLIALTMLSTSPAFTAFAADTASAVEQAEIDDSDSDTDAEEVDSAESTDNEEGENTEADDAKEEPAGDDVGEEPAGKDAGEAATAEVTEEASTEGTTEQMEEDEEASAEESEEGSVEKDSKETGEDGIVVLQNYVENDPDIDVTAQFDSNVFPEIASLHVEKWEDPESVTPVTEATQLLVEENIVLEEEDVCNVSILTTQFLDGSNEAYTSETYGQVAYSFTFPLEETAYNNIYFVYEVSNDGTPSLMEDVTTDGESGVISFTRDNINSFTIAVAAVSKAHTFFSDYQNAIDYVRGRAVLRDNNVGIYVTDEVYQQLDLGGGEDGCQDILEHTGNPVEGDFLRNSMGYYSAEAEQQSNGEWLIQYYFAYWEDLTQAEAVDAEAASLVSSLNLKSSSLSDYDKVKAIYDYITSNVTYAYEAAFCDDPSDYASTFSSYGSFVEHHCVCQGYALMFYRLALEAGIDSRIITGTVSNIEGFDERHAWNIVKVDGVYYLLDPTWDAGKETYSCFLCGQYDFGHGNDDDNFHRIAGFREAYPVSDFKYGFSLDSLKKAPAYSLITVDNKVVSTAAQNGRAKALIFSCDECSFTAALLNEIADKTFPGVDLIVADWGSGISSLIGTYYPASIPGVYSTCSNNYDAMREMEIITGIYDGWDNSPTVFLINASNQIVYAGHGYNSSVVTIMEHMLVNSSAPAYQEDPVDYGNFRTIGLCGDNAVWRYYKNGTLRISGKGALWSNLGQPNPLGWFEDAEGAYINKDRTVQQYIYYKDVKRVVIEKGITSIDSSEFDYMKNLISIEIPSSVTRIEGDVYDFINPDTVTIYGYGNSAAKKYANKHGNKYVDLKTTNNPINYYAGTESDPGEPLTGNQFVPAEEEPNVFTLLTADHEEVKTKAENGRGKVFIFYRSAQCEEKGPNDVPESLFESLNQSEILYADVLLIDDLHAGYSKTREQIGSIYPVEFPGDFCISNTNVCFSKYIFETYDYLDVNSPTTVIMDGDSNIVYAEDGVPDNLPELVNTLVDHLGSSDPAADPIDYGEYEKSGVCGNQAVWRFYNDGTLRIRGKGNLWDNEYWPTDIGWVDRAEEGSFTNVTYVEDYIITSRVKNVIVDNGIRYIGFSMFDDMNNLNYLEIPSSVVTMPSNRYYHTVSSNKVVICGTYNSAAYKFAKASGFSFVRSDPVTVAAGKSANLGVAGKRALTYTSSNTQVATVSDKGVVKGIAPGTATITVKAAKTGNFDAITKTVSVTVTKCETPLVSKVQNVNGGVKITFNTVPGVAKYRIYYKIGNGTWTRAADVTSSPYTWKKAVSGKTYSFTVRALNQYGKYISDYNKTGKKITYAATPTLSTVSNNKSRTVTATWKKCTGITGYNVQYSIYKNFKSYKLVKIAGASKVSKAIGSLTKGKTYYVRIRSYKTVSGKTYYSGWSPAKAVKITK